MATWPVYLWSALLLSAAGCSSAAQKADGNKNAGRSANAEADDGADIGELERDVDKVVVGSRPVSGPRAAADSAPKAVAASSPKPAAKPPAADLGPAGPYDGKWAAPCKVSAAQSALAPGSGRQVREIRGDTLKATTSYYYDAACTDEPASASQFYFSSVINYKFKVAGDSKAVPGAQLIDLTTVGEMTVLFLTDEAAAKANQERYCGVAVYKAGVPLTFDAALKGTCRAAPLSYTLWQRTGDTMVMGKKTPELDSSTPALRPVELDTNVLTRLLK